MMHHTYTFKGYRVLSLPTNRIFNVNVKERPATLPENLVSFHGELLQEAEHAYLVGFGDTAVWVPMSLSVDVVAGGLHEAISMMLPQWFCEDEGLD